MKLLIYKFGSLFGLAIHPLYRFSENTGRWPAESFSIAGAWFIRFQVTHHAQGMLLTYQALAVDGGDGVGDFTGGIVEVEFIEFFTALATAMSLKNLQDFIHGLAAVLGMQFEHAFIDAGDQLLLVTVEFHGLGYARAAGRTDLVQTLAQAIVLQNVDSTWRSMHELRFAWQRPLRAVGSSHLLT